MSNYSEIMDRVLGEYGFSDAEKLLNGDYGDNIIQDFIYDLAIEIQKECLKNAYLNINTEDVYYGKWGNIKRSVESENNIIK